MNLSKAFDRSTLYVMALWFWVWIEWSPSWAMRFIDGFVFLWGTWIAHQKCFHLGYICFYVQWSLRWSCRHYCKGKWAWIDQFFMDFPPLEWELWMWHWRGRGSILFFLNILSYLIGPPQWPQSILRRNKSKNHLSLRFFPSGSYEGFSPALPLWSHPYVFYFLLG